MQIEKCKLKIVGARKRAAEFCNLQFSICNLQCLSVLLVLLVLGAWLETNEIRAEATGPFSIAQAKDRTGHGRFPHDQKEHIKIVCADCHLGAKEKPARSDQPMAKDFPHTACIRCHNFAAEFFKTALGQPSRFCAVCHESRRISRADKALRPGVFPKPQISDFDDAFSHKAHRKTLPADFHIEPINNPSYGRQFRIGENPRCTDCHQQLKAAPKNSADMKTESSHPACFVCHGAPAFRKVSAEVFPFSTDCKVCHELSSFERSPRTHLFGSIRDFRHDDHDIDIRPKRRSDFPLPTAADRLCSECHKPIELADKLDTIRLPEAGYCNACHIDRKPGLPGRLTDEVLNKLKGN